MRRTARSAWIALVSGAMMVGPMWAGAGAQPPTPSTAPLPEVGKVDRSRLLGEFVPGEVVVAFRDRVPLSRARGLHRALGARSTRRIDSRLNMDLVRLPAGRSVADAVRAYAADPAVAFAEPNMIRTPARIPTDDKFPNLWGLHNTRGRHPLADVRGTRRGTRDADMDVAQAWNTTTGSDETVIGVIDSGLNVAHPDLQGQLWENPDEVEPPGRPGEDDDGNAKVDDVNGWNFAGNNKYIREPSSGPPHGTHVAGTIAAKMGNGGVVGVCPGCRIMVLRVADNRGLITIRAIVEAIDYAVQNGADILNISLGGGYSRAERNALRRAGRAGVLTVAAASNESMDNDMGLAPSYPASYNLPHILSVAASNHHDEYGYGTGCHLVRKNTKSQCAFTNFGRYSVDVAAPGVDIQSTVRGKRYRTWNGTSMAAPHVAGVAGLLESHDDTLDALEKKNIIMNSADRTGLDLNTTMYTQMFRKPRSGKFTRTGGRVNANRALAELDTGDPGPPHDGDIPEVKDLAGRRVSDTVAWPHDVNDVYRKQVLKRGETYRVALTVPKGKDYDLFVLRNKAVDIWQPGTFIRISTNGRGRNEVVKFKAPTAAVYLHVSSWFTKGPYTLRIRCLTC